MIGHRVSRDELAGRPVLLVERVAARTTEAGEAAAAEVPAGIHVLGIGALLGNVRKYHDGKYSPHRKNPPKKLGQLLGIEPLTWLSLINLCDLEVSLIDISRQAGGMPGR